MSAPVTLRRRAALTVVAGLALAGAAPSAATAAATTAEAATVAAAPAAKAPRALTPYRLPQPEGWRVELVRLAEDGTVLGLGYAVAGWAPDEPSHVLAWDADLRLHDLGLGEPVDAEAGQVAFNRDGRAWRVGLDGAGGALPLPSGAASSAVTDLDTAGNALGTMVDLAGHSHAVAWPLGGAMVDLRGPGEDSSGLRLADDGAVIGASSDAEHRWAWRRDPTGAVTPLYVRPGRPRSGLIPVPDLISPSGTALVYTAQVSVDGGTFGESRVWTARRGEMGALDDLSTGSMSQFPHDVNDTGLVVGCLLDEWWDDDVTFRWQPTRGLVGKREMGCMTGVNAAGDSVGSGYFSGQLWRWHGTGVQELTVEGRQALTAAQINDAGQVAAEDRSDHWAYESRLVLWR